MIEINLYLLIALLFCHWAADFTHLSRPYMLAAKRVGSPIAPILDHALVHGFLMMVVATITVFVMGVNPLFILATLGIQASTHCFIDILKGKSNVWLPSLTNPANPFHWWIFGLDQLAHILVIILITVLGS